MGIYYYYLHNSHYYFLNNKYTTIINRCEYECYFRLLEILYDFSETEKINFCRLVKRFFERKCFIFLPGPFFATAVFLKNFILIEDSYTLFVHHPVLQGWI